MTHVDQRRVDTKQTLSSLYAEVQAELATVERRLRSELRSEYPQVAAVVQHGIRLGGKRLRPALLLLSGRAAGRLRNAHVVLATVVEMIHTATLMHDDVLDEAVLRRHTQTTNARWNNETSVLLGDFLLSHAFSLASSMDSTYASRVISRATNIVCEGELRQTLSSGHTDLSEDEYLAIVDAKTAELCACACELGAHYAGGDDEAATRLSAFGRNLGIAFQIADDLLDLEGTEALAGKSLGTDLAKHKMTLPMIHARDALDEPERAAFLALLAENGRADRAALADYFGRHDSFAYARAQARFYAAEARAQLAGLPDSPAKDALAALAEFAVARNA